MSSQHSDGCSVHGARQWLGRAPYRWEGWHISVDWMTDDDGRAVPVRLTLTGVDTDLDVDPGNADHSAGAIRVLSREVTKRLPLAEVLDETREVMLRAGGSGLPWVRSDTYAPEGPTTHVGRLARAAHIHAEEVAAGSRRPSKATFERLGREGVTAGSGELTEQRVRTWITEARKRGLYPDHERKDSK